MSNRRKSITINFIFQINVTLKDAIFVLIDIILVVRTRTKKQLLVRLGLLARISLILFTQGGATLQSMKDDMYHIVRSWTYITGHATSYPSPSAILISGL
jgi:hypothetical protein